MTGARKVTSNFVSAAGLAEAQASRLTPRRGLRKETALEKRSAASKSRAYVLASALILPEKFPCPPEALVTVPNKFGPAVVWPYKVFKGNTLIRCFIRGAGG